MHSSVKEDNPIMTRRDFARRLAAGSAAIGLAGLPPAAGLAGAPDTRRPKGARPNILLILSDDHGQADSGCYGNTDVRTPNIDRLAREGLRFDRAFTPTAMCTPSRSSLYTGLYPHRNGAHPNHSKIEEGVKTLPEYLKPLGYRVGLAGKQHVRPWRRFPFEAMKREAEAIRAFMTRKDDEPFCLVIATNDPHTPYAKPHPERGPKPDKVALPPYLVDNSATREQMVRYYATVQRLDAEVGRYLDMVDDLGLTGDTLAIYVSDHGAGFPFQKWTLYDAGIRIPLVVRWPGRIEKGGATGAMVTMPDLLPTFVELAGGRPPGDLDGRSVADLLLGKAKAHHDTVYGAHSNWRIVAGTHYPVRCVRTARYKDIRNLVHQGAFTNLITNGHPQTHHRRQHAVWRAWVETARDDPRAARLVHRYQHRPAEELYDLEADPHELTNLADDPKLAETKTELAVKLEAWMRRQGDEWVDLL